MSDENLDVETILAEVQAEEAAAESGGQEESHDDSGLEDGQDDDAGYGDDDDQSDESELQDEGEDEGQEDEEELEGDESEDADEELDGDEESEESGSEEVNPLQGRLDQVEQELRFLRQERGQQQQQAQARAQQQQPRKPAVNPEVAEATRIALFGGESAGQQLQEKFSPEVVRLGIARAREANEMAILQVTDPEAYYQKHLGPLVDRHINTSTKDLKQSSRQAADMAVTQQYDDLLSDSKAMDGVCKLLETLPLAGTYEENLAVAVEVYKARSGSAGQAKKTQREKARARDVAAKGTAKRRRGRGRRRSGARKKAPKHDMDNVMGDVEYLKEQERLGLLDKVEE